MEETASQAATKAARSVILDRSIYEDFYIFARALYQMGNVAERDYLTYRRLFDLVVATLPTPNLLIYLRAPVPILMDRIRRRARNMETGISTEYLTALDSYYDEWLAEFNHCPVLTIRSDDLDFVHRKKDLGVVVQRIEDRLTGREEVVFK